MTLASEIMYLEEHLEEARKRIQVSEPELDEAKVRRNKIAAVLKKAFPGSRVYNNGSVAHGDALTPLTDIDVGVVVPDPDGEYGPGKKGPTALKEVAAEAIRAGLKDEYSNLVVIVEGQKRSILVRFGAPVTPGQADFTADVIVAIDNVGADGLFIPRFACWDRSHPEKHTQLIHQAIEDTDVVYARVVRLVKHWNRTHSKPLSSWNIKALALGCITTPVTLLDGLRTWFTYAHEQLESGETEDPAKVAEKPIKLKPKSDALRALARASERLERAVELEDAGYPVLAQAELAKVFNDEEMLPAPSPLAVDLEKARMAREEAARRGEHGRLSGTPGRRPVIPVPPVPVRSWAP